MLNKDKIKELMNKARSLNSFRFGGSSSSPHDPAISGVNKFFEKFREKLREFSDDNIIRGLPSNASVETAFQNQMALASQISGMTTQAAIKSVQDFYKYVRFSAVDSIGRIGGDHGDVLQSYFNARETYIKSWGDQGQQIGSNVATGIFLARSGRDAITKARIAAAAASAAAAAADSANEARGILKAWRFLKGSAWAARGARVVASGVVGAAGGPVGAGIGLGVGLLKEIGLYVGTELLLSGVGRYAGTKYGEKKAESNDVGEIAMASKILRYVPPLIDMYDSTKVSLSGNKKFDGTARSMMGIFDSISKKTARGTSLKSLGFDNYSEIAEVYGNVGKTLNVSPSSRGLYTTEIQKYNKLSGMDVSGTFSEISSSLALTEASPLSSRIDFTANIFGSFFKVASRDRKVSLQSSLKLTGDLSKLAKRFSQEHAGNKDSAKTVLQVQNWVQKSVQREGQVGSEETEGFLDLIKKVSMSVFDSKVSANAMGRAHLNLSNAIQGLKGSEMADLLEGLNSEFHLDKGLELDKKSRALKQKKNGLGDDVTNHYLNRVMMDKKSGGLGLSFEEAINLAKFILAYVENPSALRDGDKLLTENQIDDLLNIQGIAESNLTNTLTNNIGLGNLYSRVAGDIIPAYLDIQKKLAENMYKMQLDAFYGVINIFKEMKKLGIDNVTNPTYGGSGGSGGSGDYIDPTASDGSGYAGTGVVGYTGGRITPGSVSVERDGMRIAYKGFIEEILPYAKQAGVDVRSLYGFLGAESMFGSNDRNYRGMDYIGIGQIGAAAQADVNRMFKLNLDRHKKEDNILIAAYYIRVLKSYAQGFANRNGYKNLNIDDPRFLYAMYNWGMVGTYGNISRNGGKFNFDDIPAETRTGLKNIDAALRGFDASTGSPIIGSGTQYGPNMPGQTFQNSPGAYTPGSYTGAVFVGSFGRSRMTSNPKYLKMSGAATKVGLGMSREITRAVETRGASIMPDTATRNRFIANSHPGYRQYRFFGTCATTVAVSLMHNTGINLGGFSATEKGQNLVRLLGQNSVLTPSDIAQYGAQPGDIVFSLSDNHVGTVNEHGLIVQTGYTVDTRDNNAFVTTDISSFGASWYIVRPGMDSDGNRRVTSEERAANLGQTSGNLISLKNATPSGASPKQATSPVVKAQGKKFLVNSQNGRYTVKTAAGSSVTKAQRDGILGRKHQIALALGIADSDIEIGTNTKGGSSRFVSINIKAKGIPASQIASTILRIVDGAK